jgi:small subunit ribosomal protein S3
VIGKKGEDIEKLRGSAKMMGVPVHINIEEIRKPELDAQLVAESVAQQLERRIMFRRAMKRAVQNAMRLGAEGIKIKWPVVWAARKSPVPNGTAKVVCRLHTLRADIDYGFYEGQHHLWRDRRQGLDLQGRSPGSR